MKSKTLLAMLGISLVVLIVALFFLIDLKPQEVDKTKYFNSMEELEEFVGNSLSRGYGKDMLESGGIMTAKSADSAPSAGSSESASDYSETNIQVEGVDEPDIVKNDGKYIYSVVGNKVVIVDAFPASNMEVLSEIEFENVNNIFINDDKLIVFSQDYGNFDIDSGEEIVCAKFSCGGRYISKTIVYVYDVSDRENPKLEDEFFGEGNYQDARMIGDYVYVISNQYIYEDIVLPMFGINGELKKVEATDIGYFDYPDYPDYSYGFTSIMAIDLDKGDLESEVFVTGGSSNIFVSKKNIFLVGTIYPSFIESVGDDVGIIDEPEKSVIHKISIDELDVKYVASGEVEGHVLNQFSMDEHEGNFRIATTSGDVWGGDSKNNIFVLDEDMELIGSLKGLASGEKIYSARFMGDRAYLVTFKKVDPFFVIDLSNPEEPEVLGYLKIPGYSDYLHVYDENHIIGIGKNTVEAAEELKEQRGLDFAWYQGIKISLFDVSDVENPKEVAKLEIGDRGTESFALHDHKAFLFDKEKNLLVIPITLAEIDESKYAGEIPPTAYGEVVWQGAYVLNIDEDEISVRGKVTHSEDTDETERWSWYYSKFVVQRALYMDDVLYTISKGMIKANDLDDLDDLDEINSVDLPYEEERQVYYAE